MTQQIDPTAPVTGSEAHEDRVLGRIRGEEPGPTLVCLGGLHGNEPAGVAALMRILERLGGRGMQVGEFVALIGNRAAHTAGCRFVDADLNRLWTRERVDALRAGPVSDLAAVEVVEQRALLDELEAIVSRARGPVLFLDLHTTCGGGGPFVTVGDTLQNREFARAWRSRADPTTHLRVLPWRARSTSRGTSAPDTSPR